MRKNLNTVPVYTSLGRLSADTADEMVATGRGHSLRGKAVLLLDQSGLEQLVPEMEVDPDIIGRILSAAARVESAKSAKAAGERA